jgi:GNAT superfamily N-acetyltransferase
MSGIRRATSDEEIARCYPVLHQLRPALEAAELIPAVRRMETHGFRLVFLEEDGEVRAVAGYRITEMFRTGLMLEVDDLVTDQAARSGGYGRKLFEWLVVEARAHRCSVVELDSAVHRADAHRFYYRERMHILGYHFSLEVSPSVYLGSAGT